MRKALDNFEKEFQKIIGSFIQHIEASALSPIIYHYTNDVGLRGILESGRLWLTDIFNLNDPSELEYGVSKAVDILKNKAGSSCAEIEEFTRHIDDFKLETASYFICSFSFCGNDLGQWRAYADNGRGYALGFDTKSLQKAFKKQGCDSPVSSVPALKIGHSGQGEKPIPETLSLTYNDKKLIQIQTKIINHTTHLISLQRERNLSQRDSSFFLKDLATMFYVKVVLASLFFKHEAYRNEQEYRFLEVHGKMEPHESKVRFRPYSLTRYREFDWKTNTAESLKKIVVGPAADQKGLQFAQDCVRMFCSSPVEITPSGIPYRAL